MKKIWSLGAGVQSSTGALMFPADAAVFADTGAEPQSVYTWLNWLEQQLPYPVHRVSAGSLFDDSMVVRRSQRSGELYVRTLVPFYTANPDGSKGMVRRKCTAEYKVRQIEKAVRGLVDVAPWRKRYRAEWRLWAAFQEASKQARREKVVLPQPADVSQAWAAMQADPLAESWIGISTDEAHRMKRSTVPWIVNRWPLIDANISRDDCLNWMALKGYPQPPRSACTFCPYHSDAEWLRLRNEEPVEFARAVAWERDIQRVSTVDTKSLKGMPFLHSDRVPLDQVNFKGANPKADQFGNECEGMCGV